MSLSARLNALVVGGALPLMALGFLSCDSPGDGGKVSPLSGDLIRVMYWGNVSPVQDEANFGTPTGNVRYPQWYSPDAILVVSAKLEDPGVVRGLFDVRIDPATRAYKSVTPYSFGHVVRNFDTHPAGGEMLVTMSVDPMSLQTVRCILAAPSLAVVDTVVDGSWLPVCTRYAGPSTGIATYALTPPGDTPGFYYRAQEGEEDSLILAVDLGLSDANGFDADEEKVVFGVTSPSFETNLHIVTLASRKDTVVATLPGEFVSVAISPAGDRAIVCTFELFGSAPGSRIVVVNLQTGKSAPVGVRTHEFGDVLAEFPSWDPSGNAFAFSGSGFTGEGDVYPRELWVKTKVPHP
ncbi:MAG TPA: hypothetical protein VFX92_06095 [Candidatus Krumholzibacteria bacterium]|nr:hypothetical protein [Candidatus Krumholzibacteria bacterium]